MQVKCILQIIGCMFLQQINLLHSIIQLRILVLALGEQHKWWPSSFLNETGITFLDFTFPKTKYAAALNAATAVAREAHDKFTGTGKYHLFRLPERLEEKVFQVLSQKGFAEEMLKNSKEKELDKLEFLTEYIAINEQEGPVMIGGEQDLQDEKIIAVFAKHYYEAFQNHYKTYPYIKW